MDALTRLHILINQGFDTSYLDDDTAHLGCSQCVALAINGTATHETGCPNIVRETENDDDLIYPYEASLSDLDNDPEDFDDEIDDLFDRSDWPPHKMTDDAEVIEEWGPNNHYGADE